MHECAVTHRLDPLGCKIISCDQTVGKCLSENLQTASDCVQTTADGIASDPHTAEASNALGWPHPCEWEWKETDFSSIAPEHSAGEGVKVAGATGGELSRESYGMIRQFSSLFSADHFAAWDRKRRGDAYFCSCTPDHRSQCQHVGQHILSARSAQSTLSHSTSFPRDVHYRRLVVQKQTKNVSDHYRHMNLDRHGGDACFQRCRPRHRHLHRVPRRGEEDREINKFFRSF